MNICVSDLCYSDSRIVLLFAEGAEERAHNLLCRRCLSIAEGRKRKMCTLIITSCIHEVTAEERGADLVNERQCRLRRRREKKGEQKRSWHREGKEGRERGQGIAARINDSSFSASSLFSSLSDKMHHTDMRTGCISASSTSSRDLVTPSPPRFTLCSHLLVSFFFLFSEPSRAANNKTHTHTLLFSLQRFCRMLLPVLLLLPHNNGSCSSMIRAIDST